MGFPWRRETEGAEVMKARLGSEWALGKRWLLFSGIHGYGRLVSTQTCLFFSPTLSLPIVIPKAFFFFLRCFWMGIIFKDFIELLKNCLCFIFWPHGMWHLSFSTWDRTCTPYSGRRSLYYWITRGVPIPKVLRKLSACPRALLERFMDK